MASIIKVDTIQNAAGTGAPAVKGTITNDSAASGDVGQYDATASVTTFTNYTTTGTAQNIASVSLTAGDWDVHAHVVYKLNAATVGANAAFNIAVSQNSASYTGTTYGISRSEQQVSSTSAAFASTSLRARMSLSATTTIYLVSDATFTAGNPQFVGTMQARRVR